MVTVCVVGGVLPGGVGSVACSVMLSEALVWPDRMSVPRPSFSLIAAEEKVKFAVPGTTDLN